MKYKLYGHESAREYDSFTDHLMAMTTEELHSKGDIAAELAWRDEQLKVANDALSFISVSNIKGASYIADRAIMEIRGLYETN